MWTCIETLTRTFFRNTGSASIVVSIIVFITNLRVFWSVRDAFNWKAWIIPVAGLAAGLPIGIYLFGAWDEDQLRVAIGVIMMTSAVLILIVPALFLGSWLGIKLFNIMPKELFRWSLSPLSLYWDYC